MTTSGENDTKRKEQIKVHRRKPYKTKIGGDDPSEFNTWEMVNSLVCSWIINMVDKRLHASVAYTKTINAI